jgi:hypothetical protein
MPVDSDVDVDQINAELNEAEKELIELIESPEDNTEEIKAEIHDLVNLTQKTLSNYAEIVSRIEDLNEDMKSEAKQAKRRRDRAIERLGIDETDE